MTADPSDAADRAVQADLTDPKAIVLFSDGTGNSSAKLFKTNVWRMYEAVDLGPASPGKRKQIAFYDNGVGTSSFRPLAVLGGVFGYGLKRNILDIYRYACRNYAEGDEIYAFGFSRGAFTIRLVMALIAEQGLVVAKTEQELERKSEDAYRAFRSSFLPRYLKLPTLLWRGVLQGFSNTRRRLTGTARYDRSKNLHPTLRFIGVWDTVAAYGGPFLEITRGIDNWLYALSMPDYQLNERIACARHALAIDDERDAFQPLLWDEVHEDELVRRGGDPDRLQQVWFTGMHSDVGGGYPDESLSYVSFLWMLNEARRAGLRTLRVVTERFRALANSAGPIHDSRSGIAAYYRYQPRNIGAWLHPPHGRSILQDPHLVKDGAPQGLLTRVRVHESVLARIASGTDGYAPFALPEAFDVVPDPQGETALQRDDVTPEVPEGEEVAPAPLLSKELRERLRDADRASYRSGAMKAVWDLVWWRRVTYFLTLILTLLLLSLPWWIEKASEPPILADGRSVLGSIIGMVALATPDFVDPLVETLAANGFYVVLLLAGIVIATKLSRSLERRLRDRAREIWQKVLEDDVLLLAPAPSILCRVRASQAYRRFFRGLKWYVWPAVAAAAIVALAAWLLFGTVAQIALAQAEAGRSLCPNRGGYPQIGLARFEFDVRSTCVPAAGSVERGQRYVIEFAVGASWSDGGVPATPEGLSAFDMRAAGILGVPMRRVVAARYLQPIAVIRREPARFQSADRVHMEALELEQVGDAPNLWRATFVAPRSGELALFANEAVFPRAYGLSHFYQNNSGTACVTIWRADQTASDGPGTSCAPIE